MAGETLVNVKADTVDDFMENVAKAIGEGDGVMGETTYEITPKFSTGDDDEITKITFDLKVTIRRAHWSGGKADANTKKAIKAAEDLNAKHEAKHKKLAEDITGREFPKAIKALKGKTKKDMQDALDAITKQIDDAYKALDKKEGATEITKQADGTYTVKQVGA